MLDRPVYRAQRATRSVALVAHGVRVVRLSARCDERERAQANDELRERRHAAADDAAARASALAVCWVW